MLANRQTDRKKRNNVNVNVSVNVDITSLADVKLSPTALPRFRDVCCQQGGPLASTGQQHCTHKDTYTVKFVFFFVCPLFRKFRDLGAFAKIAAREYY